MEQAAKAPFDEKLSIISLILAKLDVEFKAYAQKEDYLEVLFGELKAFKRSLEDKTEAGETMKTVPQTPINIFSHQIEAFTVASEQKQKAGLLTRQEKYRCTDIAADMNRYLQTVKAELYRVVTRYSTGSGSCLVTNGQNLRICALMPDRHWSMPLISWKERSAAVRRWWYLSQN